MQLIKNKTLMDDQWQFVSDDAELCSGDICVSLARWLQDKTQLLSHDGKLGVRIAPADNVADLADDLSRIQLVELDFPDFADGRLFSHAWLLRGRYGYQGEVRACGHFMPDQVFYLSRVGVDAFKPDQAEYLPKVLENLNDFSVHYQASIQN
ncbi:DUF934 domain-containing protein [Methylosoma difficile]